LSDVKKRIENRVGWKSKWGIIAVCGVLAFAVTALLAYRLYKRSEPDLLVRGARELLAKKDYTGAILDARRALQINPASADACRIIASILESIGNAEAIDWRRRVLRLAPDSLDDKLALAATALRLNQPYVAGEALELISDRDKRCVAYESTAGAVAVANEDFAAASRHYEEALRIDPNSESNRFNCANALLRSPIPGERETGLQILERLRTSAKFAPLSLRALTTDLAAHNQLLDAQKFSSELQSNPGVEFSDKLNHLDLLQATGSAEFRTFLHSLEQQASIEPANVGMLMAWMARRQFAGEAITWGKQLPSKAISNSQTGANLANCYIAIGDWEGLKGIVAGLTWGDAEYLRHAYLARAMKELGDADGFRKEWRFSESAAANQSDDLRTLIRLVDSWGWKDLIKELLVRAAQANREQEWALFLLYQIYAQEGNTRQMCWAAAKARVVDPTNESAENNFAMLSLLLKNDVDRATELARALYSKQPTNPVFTSTYAYALHLAGRTQDALRIMSVLRTDQLRDPSIAAYYGIFLAASGAHAEAAGFLELAKKATLLPEEKQLVASAVRELN
jgi:tetratricopeptide (TPR) repeat protein